MGNAVEPRLKELNQAGLATLLVLNAAAFWVTTHGLPVVDLASLAEGWQKGVVGAVVVAVSGILNALLPADMKARLVFWRWDNPLPGSRAFTYYLHRDERIDAAALRKCVGEFPTAPKEQNALWYQLYRAVRDDPAVVQAHKAFLFARDYAAMSWLLLGILGFTIWFFEPAATAALAYLSLLAVQYVAAVIAARHHGERMVGTVLAITGANERQA